MANDVEQLKIMDAKLDDLAIEIGDQSDALDSIDTKVTDIPDIYIEQKDQGTTLDSINTEIADQGTTLDSIDIEQGLQGTTLDAIETEQLAQGTTLDAIETEQGLQGLTLDNIETEQGLQGLTLDNIETEQGLQGLTLDSIEENQTDGTQKTEVTNKDSTTGAIKVVNYSHNEIHSGSSYFHREYHLLAKNTAFDHLIVTPNNARWAHTTIGIKNRAGIVIVLIYEATEVSANGAAAIVRNRNRNNSPVVDDNTTLVFASPTVTGVGTLLGSYSLGAGKNKPGGESRDAEEIVLKQGTNYLVRITEQNVEATTIDVSIDFYEHTNN